MENLRAAKLKYRATGIKWGFIWALWTAVLWGAWYVPGTALWYEPPFSELSGSTQDFLLSAAVITALNAVAVLVFLYLWTGVLQKWRDYWDTLKQFTRLSKWYFLGAIFGGPVAIFGSYLAMGYVGGVFAAVAALMYPIVGAVIAKLWYNEKLTKRAAVGIILIVVGGITAYAPGMLAELGKGGTGAWLGYLGGLMAAIGWGIEGAIAGRALDVSDPDVGLTIRFTAETIYWVVIVLPLITLLGNAPVGAIVAKSVSSGSILLLLILAGITFGFCYVSWYKSFPLIGVGRGQAIGDLYGLFAIAFMAVFTLEMPEWNFIVASILSVIGGFVMYTEGSEVLEVVRSLPASKEVEQR